MKIMIFSVLGMNLLLVSGTKVEEPSISNTSIIPPYRKSGLTNYTSTPEPTIAAPGTLRLPNLSSWKPSNSTYTSFAFANGSQLSSQSISGGAASSTTSALFALASAICNDPFILGDECSKAQSLSSDLEDECVLWNTSCSGNMSEAIHRFNNRTKQTLLGDDCFSDPDDDCDPDLLSVFDPVRDWMRTSNCTSIERKYGLISSNDSSSNCCPGCWLWPSNVDVYYWPVPNPNTSCLSIVGNTVNSIDYGATTDSARDNTYWGCTVTDSKSGETIATTAELQTTNSITIKRYHINPWNTSQPCSTSTSVAPNTTATRQAGVSLQARGHSLVVPSSVSGQSGPIVVTSMGYTL